MADSSPVLVTGLPRSGTSWVGKMLEASGRLVYVNEPLNPGHPPGRSPGVLNARVTHRFQYICSDNEQPWLDAFRRTVELRYGLVPELRQNRSLYDLARCAKYLAAFTQGRLRSRDALLDDPFAIFSSAWFRERLGCRCVVLVREPVSFVGSWHRLGWTVHFHELLEQQLLMRDYLGEYADRMRQLIGSPDWLARTSLLWQATYETVQSRFAHLPGVYVIRYEDLAMEPMSAFAALYDSLGLPWSQKAQKAVLAATGQGQDRRGSHPWTMRGGLSRTAYRAMDSRGAVTSGRERLHAEERARVRELTAKAAIGMGYPEGRDD